MAVSGVHRCGLPRRVSERGWLASRFAGDPSFGTGFLGEPGLQITLERGMDFDDAQSGKAVGTAPCQLGLGFNSGSRFRKREGEVETRSVGQAYGALHRQAAGTDVDAGGYDFLAVQQQL